MAARCRRRRAGPRPWPAPRRPPGRGCQPAVATGHWPGPGAGSGPPRAGSGPGRRSRPGPGPACSLAVTLTLGTACFWATTSSSLSTTWCSPAEIRDGHGLADVLVGDGLSLDANHLAFHGDRSGHLLGDTYFFSRTSSDGAGRCPPSAPPRSGHRLVAPGAGLGLSGGRRPFRDGKAVVLVKASSPSTDSSSSVSTFGASLTWSWGSGPGRRRPWGQVLRGAQMSPLTRGGRSGPGATRVGRCPDRRTRRRPCPTSDRRCRQPGIHQLLGGGGAHPWSVL